MALISTSITKILTVLQDPQKLNYQVPELSQYFNLAISFLSRELAKWGSRTGVTNTTLTYGIGIFSQPLPSDFLALCKNEKGEDRVFNASNSYDRLSRSEVSDLDDWESETAADSGTVGEFIIDGANMIVHPRAKASTSIKLYYHQLASIVDDSSTMPWSGWFSDPIEQFVLRMCHLRSEMGGFAQVDVADYERLSRQCRDLLTQRERTEIRMTPAPGVGW